jgi:uncharacterized protein (TIGR03086 family)
MVMIDIGPAAERMAKLVASVADDQLDAPTPCAPSRLGDLIDHVGSLTVAFTGSAHGEATAPPPEPSAANLEAGWRERISRDLAALADAWREPGAWEGFVTAGGFDMPAEVAGLVVLDELVVHGWDVAVASSQPYEMPTPAEIEAATSFVEAWDSPRDGTLFGPIVPVPETATPLDQLLGLTGRDPAWRPQP